MVTNVEISLFFVGMALRSFGEEKLASYYSHQYHQMISFLEKLSNSLHCINAAYLVLIDENE